MAGAVNGILEDGFESKDSSFRVCIIMDGDERLGFLVGWKKGNGFGIWRSGIVVVFEKLFWDWVEMED